MNKTTLLRICSGLILIMVAACGAQKAAPKADEPDLAPLVAEVPKPDPADSFFAPVLDQLDDRLAASVTNGHVASLSYALIKDGQRVRSGFFGSRTLGGEEPVNDKTIYRLSSMTKPVTAVAILMLQEDGKLDLDDPITKYLPEMQSLRVSNSPGSSSKPAMHSAPEAPTVRQLLTHTAGFGYAYGKQDYVNRQFVERNVLTAPSMDELVRRTAGIPLKYDPGTAWSYSIASDLQGAIIERITGQSLGDFMQARIFGPLNMTDTAFAVSAAQKDRLADATAWTPDTPIHRVDGPLATMDRASIPVALGGQGLLSTLADYERFALMLLNDGTLDGQILLKPESVTLLRTNALPVVDPAAPRTFFKRKAGTGYGFGVGVVTDTIQSGLAAPEGTYYWDGASGTWFWIDPKNHVIFIGLQQNFSPAGVNRRPSAMRSVYHAIYSD
tara:strand:+ start:179 stop:1504 length:1326 start_codon:yes stop_codon:yes gene_type:complete